MRTVSETRQDVSTTKSNVPGIAPSRGVELEQHTSVAPAATSTVVVEQEAATAVTTYAMTAPSPLRPRVVSDFDMSRMPVIHKRTLYPWSVHRSLTNGKFIATVARATSASSTSTGSSFKLKHVQFPFPTEREARKFCKAYSPPKLVTHAGNACMLCQNTLPSMTTTQQQNLCRRHCRNCGAVICERCTHRWGLRMVPKTYVPQIATTVRVCKSCDWLSNAFCMALLQGRYQDAQLLLESVRVSILCL